VDQSQAGHSSQHVVFHFSYFLASFSWNLVDFSNYNPKLKKVLGVGLNDCNLYVIKTVFLTSIKYHSIKKEWQQATKPLKKSVLFLTWKKYHVIKLKKVPLVGPTRYLSEKNSLWLLFVYSLLKLCCGVFQADNPRYRGPHAGRIRPHQLH
jgi:hypothetical protein